MPLCIQRKPGCPWLSRKPERKRAPKPSPKHILIFKDPFGHCLSPGFYPAISWPIAHHYITMNFPGVPPSSGVHSEMQRTRTGRFFQEKMGRWEGGGGKAEIIIATPIIKWESYLLFIEHLLCMQVSNYDFYEHGQ